MPGRQPGPQDRWLSSLRKRTLMIICYPLQNKWIANGFSNALTFCPNALTVRPNPLTICLNALPISLNTQTECSYDLTVGPSNVWPYLLFKIILLCLSGFELYSWWVPLSHAVCLADFSRNHLLWPKTLAMFPFSWDFWSCARQRNRSSFTDVHFWTCKYMGRKKDVCRFCSLMTQISFFMIPKVFFSLNVYSIAWIPVWGD